MKDRSPGAVDLFEEAVALLRQSDAATLLCYYAGSFPFILCFLYFWADMSASGMAGYHLPEASLGIAFLYIWMKCWQAAFTFRLKSRLFTGETAPVTRRRALRLILLQAGLQPTSLFVMPLAFLMLLPFGWFYAFYHNITILGDGDDPSLKNVTRASWKLGGLWPGQNHKLLCFAPIFAIVIFLNVGILLLFIPELLHIFFGIETMFRMSGFHILNTTFVAVCVGLTYLCLNPLMHTVYVLRCFYGESRQTGTDLKIQLATAVYE
jgi:hypothetical protein